MLAVAANCSEGGGGGSLILVRMCHNYAKHIMARSRLPVELRLLHRLLEGCSFSRAVVKSTYECANRRINERTSLMPCYNAMQCDANTRIKYYTLQATLTCSLLVIIKESFYDRRPTPF